MGSRLAAIQVYLPSFFNESFDRRFVFGFVLARSNITVCLADRSGTLGSENCDMHNVGDFHIHRGAVPKCYPEKVPHLLVCVIAGFDLFEACKLGWDTSLTVVPRSPTDSLSCMSFDVPYGELEVRNVWYGHNWRLKMPKPRADEPSKMSYETEAFILFQLLSL
jgi:hypothetical protein